MSKHMGSRHDDGLDALRGAAFALLGMAGLVLVVAWVVAL